MNNESVVVSVVSAVSGIIVAYIANVAAKKVQHKKEKDGPIDRFEQMFKGYDRLIKHKDAEDERKAMLIAELQKEIILAKELVAKLEEELRRSRNDIIELKRDLEHMRKEYKLMKEGEGDGTTTIRY